MYEERKGNQQLLEELNQLRSKVAQLERSKQRPRQSDSRSKEDAELLKLLMNNTSDFIMIADFEAKPIAFNNAYAEIMKLILNIEMKPGIQPHRLCKDEEAVAYWDTLYARVLSGETFTAEYSHRIDKGDVRHFLTSFNPIIENGQVTGFSQVTRDLTAYKKVEEALRKSEARYRSLFEGIPNPVSILESDGTVLMMNRSGADALGRTVQDIVGKNIFDVLPLKDDEMRTIFQNVIREGVTVPTEDCLDTPFGRKWFLSVIQPVSDDKGNRSSIQVLSYDITDQKKTREELVKAQRLESLGVLSGGIAHDFNNLLAGLFGCIEVAKRRLDDKITASMFLEMALQSLKRATDLTEQLLTFAKGGSPKKQYISVDVIIKKAADLALSGSNLSCRFDISDDLFMTEADEGQLHQVFNNILLNARQAMPEGGTITVKAENVKPATRERDHRSKRPSIRIAISDQGCGIPPEVLQNVFDPFFTTKKDGTGLGLAVSYSIIKKHDGHIEIDSKPGKGTTVTIHLPATDDFPSYRSASTAGADSKVRYRILVMDDEPAVLNTTSAMLREMRHEVECATNGRETVEAYQNALNADRKFDLVILDATISGGAGGEQVIKDLQAIDPEVKGIVSSGYSESPVFLNPTKYGFKGWIAKPYLIDDLIRVILSVMDPTE